MIATETFPHGTYAGYQRHLRRKSEPCRQCREAHRAYVTEYRTDKNNRWQVEKNLAFNRARSRALWRLADRYRAEFDALVQEELDR